jgi:hypothetical protein
VGVFGRNHATSGRRRARVVAERRPHQARCSTARPTDQPAASGIEQPRLRRWAGLAADDAPVEVETPPERVEQAKARGREQRRLVAGRLVVQSVEQPRDRRPPRRLDMTRGHGGPQPPEGPAGRLECVKPSGQPQAQRRQLGRPQRHELGAGSLLEGDQQGMHRVDLRTRLAGLARAPRDRRDAPRGLAEERHHGVRFAIRNDAQHEGRRRVPLDDQPRAPRRHEAA